MKECTRLFFLSETRWRRVSNEPNTSSLVRCVRYTAIIYCSILVLIRMQKRVSGRVGYRFAYYIIRVTFDDRKKKKNLNGGPLPRITESKTNGKYRHISLHLVTAVERTSSCEWTTRRNSSVKYLNTI